jgi:hypothetical protein
VVAGIHIIMAIFQRRSGSVHFDPQPAKGSAAAPAKRRDREACIVQIRGLITYSEAANHLFILQPQGDPSAAGGDLLCSLGADLRPMLPTLRHLLVAGQQVLVVGTHIVPSVYKPFEFEVTHLKRFPSPH